MRAANTKSSHRCRHLDICQSMATFESVLVSFVLPSSPQPLRCDAPDLQCLTSNEPPLHSSHAHLISSFLRPLTSTLALVSILKICTAITFGFPTSVSIIYNSLSLQVLTGDVRLLTRVVLSQVSRLPGNSSNWLVEAAVIVSQLRWVEHFLERMYFTPPSQSWLTM